MISLKKLLYKMVEAINANHLPAATTADEGMVLGIRRDGTYGLIPQSGDGGGGWETVVLTGTIEHVASRKGTGSRTYSRAELASLGISNFDEWTVVSVKQTDLVGGGYRYGAMYNTDLSGMATYGNSYPLVFTQSNSDYFFCINVLNTRETAGEYDDIDYEVVLARKAGSTAHNFKVLNFTVSNVQARSEKFYAFTDAMLAEQGISDMLNYEVVSISTKPTDRNSIVYNAHYTVSGGTFIAPSATYTRTEEAGVMQGLNVGIYNVYSTEMSFDVRMVLLRVA